MSIYKNLIRSGLLFVILIAVISCEKQDDWLSKKSSLRTVVPETLKDYQAVLDNTSIMNTHSEKGNVLTDNFIVLDVDNGSLTDVDRNVYTWQRDVWPVGVSHDWNRAYQIIAFANIVLDGTKLINPNLPEYNNIVGQAHFYRAFSYYNLVTLFCEQYGPDAKNKPGLPIRLTSDVNVLVGRSSLEDGYRQILEDAERASRLLNETGAHIFRPSKLAAFSLLAKLHLNMENYADAKRYADSVLLKKSTLIDFNNPSQVSHSLAYKFPANGIGNSEIIFYSGGGFSSITSAYQGNIGYVNPELYEKYDDSDLRREFYFVSNGDYYNYGGSYTGSFAPFCGLSLNEVLLIKAESNTRLGKLVDALKDLNYLLLNRYKSNTSPIYDDMNEESLIRLIIEEKRKELPHFGNVRLETLKRINRDPRFATTISRVFDGTSYALEPNSPRYIFPIPFTETQYSGVQ